MGKDIRCARCRRVLADEDVKSPDVFYSEHGIMCADCASDYRTALSTAEEASHPRLPEMERAEEPATASGDTVVDENAERGPEDETPDAPGSTAETPSQDGGEQARPGAGDGVTKTEEERAGEAPEPSAESAVMEMLENIRREASLIRRSLLFEKSSVWNVLGAVVQCFAVAALVMACARWAHDPVPLLLIAVMLQVMTLTFYFHGK